MDLAETNLDQFLLFQIQALPDVVVPRLRQDQEEDDLLLLLRHAQEGIRRGPQGEVLILSLFLNIWSVRQL